MLMIASFIFMLILAIIIAIIEIRNESKEFRTLQKFSNARINF